MFYYANPNQRDRPLLEYSGHAIYRLRKCTVEPVIGILKGKRWGVYCLAGAWALTGVINLVFVPRAPLPFWNIYLAVLLVIAFFLFLLPVWQKME